MPFKSGESGNYKGRPVGSTNHVTNEVREFIANFINAKLETIEADFQTLEPHERLMFIERLFKYILPKQIDAKVHTWDIKQITGMEIH